MSSLDMSLGDILAKNRTTGSTRGRGAAPRGGRNTAPIATNESGPIRNKRQSGNQPRSTPYQRAPQQQQQQQYVPQPIQYQQQPINLGFAPSNAAGGKWTHDLYTGPQQAQQVAPAPVKKIVGDTVHVSNLAPDVTDDDVREIFERIGTVKSSTVNYNSSGKSTGTATVVFARNADAQKAVDEYDEAEVDGRVMKLKLIGSVVSAPVVVKKQKPVVVQQQKAVPQVQLAYIQQPIQPIFQQPKQPKQQYQQQQQQQRPAKQVVSRGGDKAARGGRGAAAASTRGAATPRAPRAAAAPKTAATQEDLDKEMDSYHSSAAPAPAPAAATQAAGQPTTA